jgi:uncharacterized protein
MTGPSFLYLHGFASSVQSHKARAFAAWAKDRGIALDVLDLRVPSMAGLRFSAIKARVREAIDAGGPRGRSVLIGSSLGGLTACRVAEEEPRVAGVFLMAPAFRLAERWRTRLGEEAFRAWEKDGFLEVDDYGAKSKVKVEYGFVEELARLDAANDGWPDVRVPTCIVHGTKDDVVSVDLSRTWSRDKRARAPRRSRRRARARRFGRRHPRRGRAFPRAVRWLGVNAPTLMLADAFG